MAHIVCLSDIHFGEPYSLLQRSDLPAYAARMVSWLAGGKIDKLVLVGDVWELAAPESVDAAFPVAKTFFDALTNHADHGIELPEVVWVVGNHDHELWSYYCKQAGIEPANTDGWVLDPDDDTARHLLDHMFGEEALPSIGKVTVYNPFYVEKVGQQNFLFTHGHYFDDMILGGPSLGGFKQRVMALVSGAWCEPKQPKIATTVQDLEARSAGFIDAVWGRQDSAQTLRTQSWELLTRWRQWSSCTTKGDPATPQFAMLGNLEQTFDLPVEADNMRWFLRTFVLPKLGPEQLSLVYGHFHRGGNFDLPVDNRTVRVFNTGAWITSHKGTVPHSHVVMIDDKGNVDQRAVRFRDELIDESVDHGMSVRMLDVPNLADDSAERANVDVF